MLDFSRKKDGTTVATRINGSVQVLQGLWDPDAAIRPKLFTHRRCTRLVECLPSPQHDPNPPEDVLKLDVGEIKTNVWGTRPCLPGSS